MTTTKIAPERKPHDEAISLLRSWLGGGTRIDPVVQRSTSAELPLPRFYRGDGESAEAPGTYPFTRSITPDLYHDGPWVMGMYSGYASPEETRERFRRLIDAGQTGLSIALDLPTQIGVDCDHPLAAGEVGKVGVPISSVENLLDLLRGLPLDQVRQMRTTANAIGAVFAAFALVALEELEIDPASFRLFIQNDPLKEFSARGTWIFPPQPSLVLAVDVLEYFARHHPTWQPIQFCGYHIRDAGGTIVQELAVATANGMAYLDEAVRRGVDIAEVAPQLFLFLSTSVDLFEEAAKLRAARRLWARILHERYAVPADKAAVKIFVYTLGGALTAQEPMNNITRVAYEALAAALGGAQTLATSSWDEALGLPSDESAHLSLRTQQVLAYESGVTKVVDPLGGSHYVEALTEGIVDAALRYTLSILEKGGAVAAIEQGFIADELAESAWLDYQRVARGERVVVGVNFKARDEPLTATPPFTMPAETELRAKADLARLRASRDGSAVAAALTRLEADARERRNVLPALIDAARARVTIGEITRTLAGVYGRHEGEVARHLDR